MISDSEKRRLKLERPFVVFFYRLLARWLGGYKFLLLTTTGRKSGRSRTVPLVYMPVQDGFVVIAANIGLDAQPGWFLNLKSTPQAQIQIGRKKITVIAEEAAEQEREELWANWIQQNIGYKGFQDRTSRRLPVVILRPLQASREA